jgi:hypothetical protein
MKSKGSVEFRALGVKLEEWERRLKKRGIRASVSTVSAWQLGTRSCPIEARELIHSEWNGPHPDAWEEFLPDAPPLPAIPLEDATPERVGAAAARLLQHVRMLQQELEMTARDSGEGLGARVRMAESIAGVLGKLGAMTGTKLTERMILESPLLKEIVSTIAEALGDWPDAQRAAADALERLRTG